MPDSETNEVVNSGANIGALSFEDKLANFILASAYSNEHIDSWLEGVAIPDKAKNKQITEAKKKFETKVREHVEAWEPYLKEGQQLNIRAYAEGSLVNQAKEVLANLPGSDQLTVEQIKDYLLNPKQIPNATPELITKIKQLSPETKGRGATGDATEINYETVAVTLVDKTLYVASNTKSRLGVSIDPNTKKLTGLDSKNKYLSFSLFQDADQRSHAANRVAVVDQLQAELQGVADFDRVVFIGIGDTPQNANDAAKPHAEMQLLRYFKDNDISLTDKTIGISKPACSSCTVKLQQSAVSYRDGTRTNENINTKQTNWLEPSEINGVKVIYEANFKQPTASQLTDYRVLTAANWRRPSTRQVERLSDQSSIAGSKYSNNVIVQLDGDVVSFNAALRLFHKYPANKVKWLQWNPQQGQVVDALTGQPVSALPMTVNDQMLLVGHSEATLNNPLLQHGSTLAGLGPEELTSKLLEHGLQQVVPKKISLVGCGLGAVDSQQGSRFVTQVAEQIAATKPEAKVIISAQDTVVKVNAQGQKETLRFMEDGQVIWKAGDHQHKVVVTTNGSGGVSEQVFTLGEGEKPLSQVDTDIIKNIKIEDALSQMSQTRTSALGVDADAFFSPAKTLQAARLNDQKLIQNLVEQKLTSLGKQATDFVGFAEGTDLSSGKLVIEYQDAGQRKTQRINTDQNQFRTTKVINGFRQEFAKGTARTSRALGIFMTLKGMESLSDALTKGDAKAIAANSAMTLYGVGELANMPPKILTGTGDLLAKATASTANGLSEIAARNAAPALANSFAQFSRTGAAGIRAFSKLLAKATPLIGVGLGIHGMSEDLKDPDKVRGTVNFVLDFFATATGALASIPSPLSPLFEAFSIGFTIARLGFGTLYDNVKKALSELPDDASWQQRADAFFEGLGNGIEQLFYEFHPIGNIMNALQQSEALEDQYREDVKLLSLLSDYRNYFSIYQTDENGPATIDFASAPASYYGGNLQFKLGDPGYDSSLIIDNMVDTSGEQKRQTFSVNTEGVQNIVLGIGQSPEITMESRTVKMLWVIPINTKQVIVRNEGGGINTDEGSRNGTYEGNDKNNVFQTIQQQTAGAPLSSYSYTMKGLAGDDLFILGPQQIMVSGDQGADTYIAGENAAEWLTINNFDDSTQPGLDTLIVNAELNAITAYKLQVKEGREKWGWSDDVLVVYKDKQQKTHYVRIQNWFKGSHYQHLQIKTQDGYLVHVGELVSATLGDRAEDHSNGNGERTVVSRQPGLSNEHPQEAVSTHAKILLTPVAYDRSSTDPQQETGAVFNANRLGMENIRQITGTSKGDQLTGNALANVLNGYGSSAQVDKLVGGEGNDVYLVQSYLDRANSVEIDNRAHDKAMDYIVLGAERSHLSSLSVNGEDITFSARVNQQAQQQKIESLTADKAKFQQIAAFLKHIISQYETLSLQAFDNALRERTVAFQGQVYEVSDGEVYASAAEKILGKPTVERLKTFASRVPPAQSFSDAVKQYTERYEKLILKYQQQIEEHTTYKNDGHSGTLNVKLKYWTQSESVQHVRFKTSDNLTLKLVQNNDQYQFQVTGFDASMSAQGVVVDRDATTGIHPYVDLVSFAGSQFGDRLTGNDKNNILQGGGNGGTVYSYDTLIGGNGHDVYIYTPKTDGLVVVDTNADDGKQDIVLFNAKYEDIKTRSLDLADSSKSIHLGKSIWLRLDVADQKGGLVVQHFQQDNKHRNLMFKSIDGVYFKVDHQSLVKQRVNNNDVGRLNQLVQSMSSMGSQEASSEVSSAAVLQTDSPLLTESHA
ncbi:C80 family cysteine peptidase [Zooshikella sp. RANM57]|uniref:C80 family cysteine peptidase n=1 Tax=Zooshikella sp. RANM57 TaxID=3425863 RepID=UPI003D6E9108